MVRQAQHWFFLLLLAVLPFTVISCDSGGDEGDPVVTGSWFGTTTVQGDTFTMDVQLTERDSQITGNGTMTFVETVAVTVQGTHNFPNVSITLQSTGFEDLNFNGTLSGDGNAITGSLRGSGFDNFSITIRKQ